METKSFKVKVIAHATPQGLSLGFLNSVSIRQSWEIEELLVDENDDGNITSLGSYPDPSFPGKPSVLRFKVQDFAPTTVHQLIHNRFNDPLLSRLITDQIVVESRRRDLPQGPLSMTVFVKFTEKDYVVMPCNSAPLTTTVEEPCAICLEDMSELGQAFCQPPGCVHVFHEDCFVKWLGRHDSCPLCRLSTNPLTNNPSRILEELTEACN
ncbi:hypothetical protein DY000_02057088 [Brassica cretica]|uniref:RING-type domain-containing protein n=1 Tax=Brassica cretica TaxID=69181 RepID=A0ABQ7AGW2_BRACR|nr:hypothetical protein DY000_02057088 [Brassica cretica]